MYSALIESRLSYTAGAYSYDFVLKFTWSREKITRTDLNVSYGKITCIIVVLYQNSHILSTWRTIDEKGNTENIRIFLI